ncbi:hypothetical protein HQQ88_14330 [Curtobacterium sp. VKM Ac-2861]|uniref:hypothetical protein n=1 Tax=Curtobacterium sp. VKM Ac-2861 TaxID=2739016 RepID=UPI0015635270|nr:hypothetical protein [Curtobacterium sp. VKM Ac-2861]
MSRDIFGILHVSDRRIPNGDYQSWAGRSTRGGKVEVVGITVTLDRSDATR